LQFIIDAQLPPDLARWMAEAGHQAKHVEEIGLRNAEDSPIWRYTLDHGAVLLTKDEELCGAGKAKPAGSAHCLVADWQLLQSRFAGMVYAAVAGHRGRD